MCGEYHFPYVDLSKGQLNKNQLLNNYETKKFQKKEDCPLL